MRSLQAASHLLLAHKDLQSLHGFEHIQQLQACLHSLGEVLFRTGRHEEAELALLKWLELASTAALPRGSLLAHHKALTPQAPKVNPHCASQETEAGVMLGVMRMEAGLMKHAEVSLRLALGVPGADDRVPCRIEAYRYFAEVLVKQGKFQVWNHRAFLLGHLSSF